MAKAAEAGGADILSLINTLTGMKIDINRRTFALANKTGGMSGPAGEMIIQLMFNGFVALGAPTTIQNVVTGAALLLIVALTTKPVKGLVVK